MAPQLLCHAFKKIIMKNIKIIIIFCVFINIIQCKAQQLPLNTDFETVPANSHLKDFNNELDSFIGEYKAVYQGYETTLYITKVEDKIVRMPDKDYYTDALVIRYKIKNSSGVVVQDTQSNTNNKFYSIWSAPQENGIVFLYPGTNCGVGSGKVFLFKINATQLSWEYRPEGRIFVDKNVECPGNPDTKVYLPETKDLIFTKQ